MKKLLLLPTLLLALNLGAATTEATITTSPKKERSLKQRHDKWVAKNPNKNMFISPVCLITYACIANEIARAIDVDPLSVPLVITAACAITLMPVKFIHDTYKANQYQWKKLNQINQLKKEIAKLKQQ